MASLVTTSRMQQCFNVLIDIYHEFLLLFYCCVLLEIKLTTTTIFGNTGLFHVCVYNSVIFIGIKTHATVHNKAVRHDPPYYTNIIMGQIWNTGIYFV